jgi:hypothetical protein
VSLKVEKTPTSLAMEWGCMDLNHMKGFNNLGMKRVSSFVQGYAPTSSIEDEPTFIELDEDSETPNSVSYNSDDNFNGHNNTSSSNLHILKRNGHDNNTNVLSLGRYGWKGTKCDVDIEGVFVVRG